MPFDIKGELKGVVSVIGASSINDQVWDKTVELGRVLAKNGYAVACGGLMGVMQAVCKGVKEEGGLTIGIIPSKNKQVANEYVDIAIPVPFSQARNIVVVLSGDAVVAVSGKAGTLTEIALAWIYQKPIIALTGVGGWSSEMAGKQVDDRRTDKILEAKTPQDVISLLNEVMKNLNYEPDLNFSDMF